MNLLHSPRPKLSKDQSRLLILCLVFSLLLHIAVVLLLPLLQQQESQKRWQQQPTIVQLVDRPQKTKSMPKDKPHEFEIDPLPVKPQPEIPVESFRQADRNQKVEREQAPKGDDVRDQTTLHTTPAPPSPQTQKPQDKSVQPQPEKPETTKMRKPQEKSTKKLVETSSPTIPVQPVQPPPTQPRLTPEQLRPDASTLNQIVSGSQGERNRVKERKDTEIGDTVWLNLQDNLLVSFFRRFHDQIELVWNYPSKAIANGIEGTLELMIIVNPKGELLDVDLRQSSGSDLLDFEAIQAVYRAAPFGPLTKHYPHEKLKIRAYFSYRLSGKIIYGRGY
jgi:periplasmic protein TonB